jgi:hypothetical protein
MSLENRLRLLFWPIGKSEFETELAERDMKASAKKGAAKKTPAKKKAAPLKPDAE